MRKSIQKSIRSSKTVRRIRSSVRNKKTVFRAGNSIQNNRTVRRAGNGIQNNRTVRRIRSGIQNNKTVRRIQKKAAGSLGPVWSLAAAKLESLKSLPPALPAACAVLIVLFIALAVTGRNDTGHSLHKEEDHPSVSEKQENAGAQEGAEQEYALKKAVQGILSYTIREVVDLKEGAQETMRVNFMEILDSGQGASYEFPSESWRPLWEETRRQRREQLAKDPMLLLVNKWHYQPDGYEVEPVTLPNGQQIGSQCYDQLMEMLEDCEKAGGTPIVCSGYRPHQYQVGLFDEQISRWLYAGYGQEEAEKLAATAVAIPGTSEHELGLAADIYSSENLNLDESQVDTFTQQWLMENCWHYGFILRYPKDKSEITGIIFEPWHYRYVGHEHAEKIHRAGICLEEYLDLAEHPDEAEDRIVTDYLTGS